MELDLKSVYRDEATQEVLCFTHAVGAAIQEGHFVSVEIDEFGKSGNDTPYLCN